MPYNQISCKTFCRRWFGCSYYKENNTYGKTIELIFNKSWKYLVSNPDKTFLECFLYQYNSRSFTGIRNVYKEDREEFEAYCTNIAIKISSFISRYSATLIKDNYLFRGRIKGYIGCVIKNEGNTYLVDFSYGSQQDAYSDIGFHKFNMYLYNTTHKSSYSGMVYIPDSNSHYLIKFNKADYTIKRGFIQTIIKNRAYNPGYQCFTCSVKNCAPRLVLRRNT